MSASAAAFRHWCTGSLEGLNTMAMFGIALDVKQQQACLLFVVGVQCGIGLLG